MVPQNNTKCSSLIFVRNIYNFRIIGNGSAADFQICPKWCMTPTKSHQQFTVWDNYNPKSMINIVHMERRSFALRKCSFATPT